MPVNRPDTWFGIAFNRDPNDPTVTPAWSDWTSKLKRVTGLERGRNYELDVPMAAEPQLIIRDVNEDLNPDNSSSPNVGLVDSYREACLLAQWPNGGTGNLFNVGVWRGNKVDAYDPTFESFAIGSVPNWITAVGGMAPIVSDTNAWQGNQKLQWSNAVDTIRQGVSWPAACIPGRQYTSSVYVRQDAASTQRISVTDQSVGADPFNLDAASGWGTDKLGHAWTATGTDHFIADGVAYQEIIAASTESHATIDTGCLDHVTYVKMIAPDPAAVGSAGLRQGILTRYTDFNNYYAIRVIWRTDGKAGISILKRVTGTGSVVTAEVVTTSTYALGQEFVLRVSTTSVGTNAVLGARVWSAHTGMPSADQISGSDGSLSTGTRVGCLSDTTSALSFPIPMAFKDFSVVGTVHGSTTTTTGSYVRLSVTWTATQPQHTVQLATTGTAAAGVARIDAIQHEQAAGASTWTASGPVIYPIFRNNIERFTRNWTAAGFAGQVTAPCVDALAALNAIDIATEYAQAVDNLAPDYWWRLNDEIDTTEYIDTSGNGGPSLVTIVSKFGPGDGPPTPGVSIAIPGDPQAIGVEFSTPGGAGLVDGVIIGAGAAGGVPGIVNIPAIPGNPWSATISAWTHLNPTTAGQIVVRLIAQWGVNSFTSFYMGSSAVGGFASFGPTGLTVGPFHPVDIEGALHHLVATVEQDATDTTVKLYVDGTVVSATQSTAATGGLLNKNLDSIQVGGTFSSYGNGAYGNVVDGVVAHVAAWNRALSAAEVSALYAAGGTAGNGETSGARVSRHLDIGGYTGPTRISAGSTVMGPPTWTGLRDLLSDSTETMLVAEQGSLWVGPDGAIVAEGRQDRWLRLTSVLTLGEDYGAGEVPYLGNIVYDRDPAFVYANVRVARNNGATAVGGSAAEIAAARRRYFPRSYSGSADFAADADAQYAADYVFHTHRAAVTRVDQIELDPAGNNALWPLVLGLEVGQRVTVKRRAKAGNAGAGVVMSADYFIEKIGAPEINFDTGKWTIKLQLSPINAGAPPTQPTFQPWVLEDPTYGVLDSTTVLGW